MQLEVVYLACDVVMSVVTFKYLTDFSVKIILYPSVVNLCYRLECHLLNIFNMKFPSFSLQDRKLSVIERPAGGGSPATLHFLSRPTVSRVISWEAVVRGEALYVEIPHDPLPEGSKERLGAG